MSPVPGRQVHQEDVEVAPVDVGEELLQRAVQHRPAPDDGLVARGEHADRDDLHAVGVGRHDHLLDLGRAAAHAEHARDRVAVDVGVDDADLAGPAAAIAAARLTVTDDLPTPPLPDATAYTRVSELGLGEGDLLGRRAAAELVAQRRRCSSLITSRSTWTRGDAGDALETAAVTSRRSCPCIGQPATVSKMLDRHAAVRRDVDALTMSSSVIGRADLRVVDRRERRGAPLDRGGEADASWYAPCRRPANPRAAARGPLVRRPCGPVAGSLAELTPRPRSSSSSSRSRSSARTKSRVATSRRAMPQGGDLAGEVLGVGEAALVAGAVPLELHPVTVGLAVLGEQDQRRGVRRLQAEA